VKRLVTATLAMALCATILTGCAGTPDVSPDAAQTLQSSVQKVAELAAAGDPSAALAELDALQASLDSAVADGEVSEKRSTSIRSSIDLVRADLTTAVAVAEAAAAKAAAAAAAAAQAAAEAQAAADARAAAKAQAAADAAAAQAAADAQKDKKSRKYDDDENGSGEGD
jgi:hypothetical protein